jgi:poly(3-hydroxybutyrate) depolymerase
MNHAALAPWRAVADATKMAFQSPFNPLSGTEFGRSIAAGAELFERTTRRYGKPAFNIVETQVDGRAVPVAEQVVWNKPFCSLLHFKRELPKGRAPDPKVLIVAPLSGHYATLLRGTVEAMLPGMSLHHRLAGRSAWCRWPPGASISRITSTTSSTCSASLVQARM